ncbi:conserved hypothetical protein [Coccidioides posadasii str. Silveira]|uniref:Uncharacterized protein n=2 Tax=Coccidioides posadasii TaxID=199306 RepID=E9DHZ5_COCPS|nr:conserved hypothetical protein [Coccidioides posadasii str. Silveira]KMM69546.1 hypothetical protein CPAG_05862 [Coccidioides posadasii RMSCC 3488]
MHLVQSLESGVIKYSLSQMDNPTVEMPSPIMPAIMPLQTAGKFNVGTEDFADPRHRELCARAILLARLSRGYSTNTDLLRNGGVVNLESFVSNPEHFD